jgi:hypothetical protein
VKVEDFRASIIAAAALLPPEPRAPKPGTTCLYRGGEVLWWAEPDPWSPILPVPGAEVGS